ncbi:NAD(P)-binding protein [Xylaria bambusicola]|uniref:NAD(P)-binding protein n=1 Tax=Xylaria bambusicola TaxID=326684 RepID=UPI002007C3D4|nr:NAD(P)-binding protein [Xylaria bambusicola]KAI0509371.1 NAD(P)-binding protein [Xylaria bambusicola]
MAPRLSEKVAIVTGSSSGLGRAIALAYSREGAAVVCADLNREARAQIAEEANIYTDDAIKADGGRAIFVKTDVSIAQDVENLVGEAVKAFGRVDILVNNAGIAMESRQAPTPVHETPESVWDITMAVNLKSVFLGSKYAITQMLQQEPHKSGHRGWIINIASVHGLVAGRAIPSYAASKAAVTNLTKQVGLDYAKHKIHSNAICPGYTKTAIVKDAIANINNFEAIEAAHPMGLGVPGDIVGAAVFLASDEAQWITGATLAVDGGYTAQ